MNDIPVWQIILMHAAPTIAALAAWRRSSKNSEKLIVVHSLVNGDMVTLKAKLAAVEAENARLLRERDNA